MSWKLSNISRAVLLGALLSVAMLEPAYGQRRGGGGRGGGGFRGGGGRGGGGFRGGGASMNRGGFRGGTSLPSRSISRPSVTRPSGGNITRPSQPIANRPGNIVNNRPGGDNIINNRPGGGNIIDNDRNIISNRPINVGDVDVNGGWGWGDYSGCCYHPVARAAAWGTAAAVTAAAIGSTVYSLPSDCVTTIVNGITYSHCGDTWYMPQFDGDDTSYVVVSEP